MMSITGSCTSPVTLITRLNLGKLSLVSELLTATVSMPVQSKGSWSSQKLVPVVPLDFELSMFIIACTTNNLVWAMGLAWCLT